MLLVVSVIIGSIIASDIGGRVASAMNGAVCRIASTVARSPHPQQQLLNSDDADEQMALQLQMQQLQEMIQLIQQLMQQQQEMANQIISNVR